MEVCFLGFVAFLWCTASALYLRINYMTHYATCLEYSVGNGGFTSYPLYEYELIENGKKVKYKNRGTATGYPREGKRQKVLIHKENHNKIMAYNELICMICVGMLSLLSSMIVFVARYM